MNIKKNDFAMFLFVYLLIHLAYWTLRLGENYTFPNGVRFLFNHTLPPMLLVLLWQKEEVRHIFKSKFWRDIGLVGVSSSVAYLGYTLLVGLILSIPYHIIVGLYWSYPATIEYYMATLIYFLILTRKHTRKTEAALLTMLLMFSAGLIYEAPIYYKTNPHIGIYYHKTHPFFINSRWFILPFLTYYLAKNFKWKPGSSKKLLLAMIPLGLFSIYYGFKGSLFPDTILSGWIPRLPTLIFLGYVLTLVKDKNEQATQTITL